VVGFTPFRPLREWNLDNDGIAETKNSNADKQQAASLPHAEVIGQIIGFDHVNFGFVADFFGLLCAGLDPGFDGAAACIFADHPMARLGDTERADDLDLEARFQRGRIVLLVEFYDLLPILRCHDRGGSFLSSDIEQFGKLFETPQSRKLVQDQVQPWAIPFRCGRAQELAADDIDQQAANCG
jgi:hypothetical protein